MISKVKFPSINHDILEGNDDGGDDDDGRILGQGQARYSNAPRD